MRAITAAATLLSVLTCAACAQPAGLLTGSDGDEAAALAADSLRADAVGLTCSPSSTPARARRLVALSRLADRLEPGNWQVCSLLADIHLARREPAEETKALAGCLAVHTDDRVRWLRWVDGRLQTLQTAEQRVAFLRQIVADEAAVPAARSEAAAMLAAILSGQGGAAEALAAARRAVELDPYGPDGLRMLAGLEAELPSIHPVDRNLRLLRGELRAPGGAWQVALALSRSGLGKEAVPFFEHARTIERAAAPGGRLAPALLTQYCNGLLDGSEAKKVVELLETRTEDLAASADLQALNIEACRATGNTDRVDRLIKTMGGIYKDRAASGEASEAFAAEQAWFFVLTSPSPNQALIYARRAVLAKPDNAVYQRILGAAELLSGITGDGKGAKRLEKLLGSDTYAAVFLAEHHFAAGRKDEGTRAVLAAAELPRSGPALRRLAAVAAKNGVTIPPRKGRDEALKAFASFDKRYLDMLARPEKYIAVEMKLPGPVIPCGEPIRLVATIKNIGPIDVPLGRRGLLTPAASLHVRLHDTRAKEIVKIRYLPLAVWPTPWYLRPGRSLQTSVRLDVAKLQRVLASRALEDVSMTVTVTLDPLADGTSSAPSIKLPALKAVCTGLLGPMDRTRPEQWRHAYAVALGQIVADLRRGDLKRRMRAARRTGYLLEVARNIEIGQVSAPPMLAGTIDKLVILSVTRALLKDRSPAVRGQMVAALADVPLDDLTIGLLAPLIEDPSPAVRFRLTELLGVSDPAKHKTVLDVMAKDSDELVRLMAKAVRRPK
jgi:tetratricopeptide (TPR) repeat protein